MPNKYGWRDLGRGRRRYGPIVDSGKVVVAPEAVAAAEYVPEVKIEPAAEPDFVELVAEPAPKPRAKPGRKPKAAPVVIKDE